MINFRQYQDAVSDDWKVCVVMPARNESSHIYDAISVLPEWIDRVVVVNDGSDDDTAELAHDAGAIVINSEGIGVGGAISYGFQHLLDSKIQGRWCAVVMAGDGQMDPNDLPNLIEPIISGNADYVKGDRSSHFEGLKAMPLRRRIGTWWLKHLTNLATGLEIHDPQCGYTVCSDRMLSEWDWSRNWDGYGYPNWWLMRCVEQGFSVDEAPVRAIYQGQSSGIRILTFLPKVSGMLLLGLFSRGSRWYLLGQRRISALKRMTVSIGFLGGIVALASTPWTGLIGLMGIPGLMAARMVDKHLVNPKSHLDKIEADGSDATVWPNAA